jgi:hypothetical protein
LEKTQSNTRLLVRASSDWITKHSSLSIYLSVKPMSVLPSTFPVAARPIQEWLRLGSTSTAILFFKLPK